MHKDKPHYCKMALMEVLILLRQLYKFLIFIYPYEMYIFYTPATAPMIIVTRCCLYTGTEI